MNTPPVPLWEKIDDKIKGIFFMVLAVATGIGAQFVLLGSVQGQDLASYFDLSTWWVKISTNTSPLISFSIYLLAILFFILGVHFLKLGPAPLVVDNESPAQRPPKLSFWLTSLGLGIALALYAGFSKGNDPDGHLFAWLWIISIGLFIYSALNAAGWRPPSARQVGGWLAAHRGELLVMAGIVIVALLIRVVSLDIYPYSFMNDEGQMGNGGVCILNGSCPNLFTLGWADQSMVAFFPAAIGVALFGNNAVGVRLPSALMGTLSVLAVYLFTRETMGRKLAWAPALLLATLPVHIHFSRLAVDNILDSLSAPLILWLIFRGIKTGSRLYYLAAGLLCGLCLYSYQGSVLAPALGLGALAYVAMRTPGFLRAHARNILTLILAGLVVGLPMLGFYALHSNMFMSRFRAEGVVGNGILQQDTQDHQENTVEVLTVDFLRSSMVYIATPAAYGFYNSPYPYLPWLGAVFLIFGLAYTLRYIKHPLFLTLFVWFLAPIILGSTLTSGPPASQRMLMSMPPLAILISLGLGKTVEALQGLGKTVAKFSPLLLIVAVLYISAVDLHFFVYDYPAGHFFEDATNELTYESRLDIVPLGAQGHLYLLGEPTTPYLDFPNFSFFAPNVEKTTLYEVTPATIAALPKDKDILFLAIPSREADLESIRQWIPGGVWKQVNRRFQPTQVLYYTYKVTKAELARFKP